MRPPLSVRRLICAGAVFGLAGCGAVPPVATDTLLRTSNTMVVGEKAVANLPAKMPTVPEDPTNFLPASAESDDPPFAVDRRAMVVRLSETEVVKAVLQRNPTLEQMRAAATAAAAKYPQAIALDDPTIAFTTAPGSAWSGNANYAARVEVAQKLPLSGKRELRGRVASAEASAVGRDVDDARLRLVEAARTALADYYQAGRSLTVNDENRELLREFRKNAQSRYTNGLAPQQDVLQADLEIARQDERAIGLGRATRVARARLNTLMHLPPDTAMAEPPEAVGQSTPLPESAKLRESAAATRPDVKALSDRIASDEAAVALAVRDYHPDVELIAAYDGFWQGSGGRPLQWQVGARVNLPIRTDRRGAAVAEAQARVAQRRAELARLLDGIALEVQEAYEQVREREQIVALFEKTLLPAAAANVKEAQTAYVNGKVPFVSLVEAQRGLTELKDRYYESVAEAARRRATLDRAAGILPAARE